MRLAIAGGGTGGHLFPGLAVAELARERGVAESIVFFGAERGIEFRAVPKAGFELVAEPVHGIVGSRFAAAVRALGEMAAATVRTRRQLAGRRIDVVVGLGGYASAPAVLAARSLGIAVVLLEQNREPGLSNRVLGHLATRVCTSFESTVASFTRGKAVCTGNPLRRGFDDRPPYQGASRDLLLVFGGSGGARSLNRAVVAALSELVGGPGESRSATRDSGTDAAPRSTSPPALLPSILHQVGKPFVDEIRDAYAKAGITAEVVAFIEDMRSVYARTRLAVCRAGATSIAELIATGTPSILVPLPTSAGGHQLENAGEMQAFGASRVVVDDADCARTLAATLAELLENERSLFLMAERAAACGRPGAAGRVLEILIELADKS